MMVILLCLSFLEGILCIGILYQINRMDTLQADMEVSTLHRIMFMGLILLMNIMLYNIYLYNIGFWFLSILMSYLILTSYIDKKTMYVYSILNGPVALFGLVYVYLSLFLYQRCSYNPIYLILTILIFSGLMKLFEKLGIQGGGDSDCFIVSSIYLAMLNTDTLLLLVVHVFLATLLFAVINLRHYNFKEQKMRREIAFTPYIAVSAFLMIIMGGHNIFMLVK